MIDMELMIAYHILRLVWSLQRATIVKSFRYRVYPSQLIRDSTTVQYRVFIPRSVKNHSEDLNILAFGNVHLNISDAHSPITHSAIGVTYLIDYGSCAT